MQGTASLRWTCERSGRSRADTGPHECEAAQAQLEDVIARKIKSGELAPDRPIPPENHLAEEYGVARVTARRAAQEPRERGLIVTVRGKGSPPLRPR
ncbi:hypothetical protein SCWH03_27820 [Streptomyces pacificus]|uniref:HTH gntR-type domain-containing protein n=1 Tax=Streptomyces pacificus TaxID=2705029 RepID=A0A6A0AW16_9ACTN|nr:hypothetical protein SCWH03_27820 [Streptomyces pacificus]